jgi:hypothetical protein
MGIALGGLIAVVTGLTGLWMLSRRRLRRPRVAMARRPEVIGVPATGGPIDPKLATEETATA